MVAWREANVGENKRILSMMSSETGSLLSLDIGESRRKGIWLGMSQCEDCKVG